MRPVNGTVNLFVVMQSVLPVGRFLGECFFETRTGVPCLKAQEIRRKVLQGADRSPREGVPAPASALPRPWVCGDPSWEVLDTNERGLAPYRIKRRGAPGDQDFRPDIVQALVQL